MFLVVAHRQKGPVNSNRKVRLANVISVIKNNLPIEERLTQKNVQRPFCRLSGCREQYLPGCLGNRAAAQNCCDKQTTYRFPKPFPAAHNAFPFAIVHQCSGSVLLVCTPRAASASLSMGRELEIACDLPW
jgi:hypothetical protein